MRHEARMFLTTLCSIAAVAVSTGSSFAQETKPSKAGGDAKVAPLMSKELANLPGKEGLMLTVEYAPGGSSAPHRHNANTFVYVLEGSIEMQVAGGQLVKLGPGQTFYEGPDDVHSVSRNASKTKKAKFVVVLLKDKGAPPVLPAQ